MMLKRMLLTIPVLVQLFHLPLLPAQQPAGEQAAALFQAGVCKVDITPPLQIPLGGYADRTGPASGVRDPLHAVTVVFDDGRTRVAFVTLDLIQVRYKEGQQIYRAIERATGIKEGHVLINASHTHGSPWLETDSCYSRVVAQKVAKAVKTAIDNLQPVRIGYGEGTVGFNVNRRVIKDDGKCISGLNPGGLTDHRLKVLRIDPCDQTPTPLAVVFHAVCHPNVLRGQNTRVTADFPGEAKAFLERSFHLGTTAVFLQGCCGNIRANLPLPGKRPQESGYGREGTEADMRWCGWSAGAEAVKTAVWLGVTEQAGSQYQSNLTIRSACRIIGVSAQEKAGKMVWRREQITDGKVRLPLKMISIGKICFVALPAEPVVEYGLKIEDFMKKSGFDHVLVMGYSDGDAGYIPASEMFEQGGYEVTDSALLPACESQIMEGIEILAAHLTSQL
ncbi:MAG: neutral/alkaline non-lysosomal ceramidase N-terminal domain-containing protein [Mangrovibacterium sp.]